MSQRYFRIDDPSELRAAGPTDLIRLVPVPGANRLYLPKGILEQLVYAVHHHELIHVSGPTGSAKSSLLDALEVHENYLSVCSALGFEDAKPVKLFHVEMVVFESPAELYQRRALKNGCTYDEKSILVRALEQASSEKAHCDPVIWLREMGRVHSASVQGGLLNLMSKADIVLPNGERIDGRGIAWVADSNYQHDADGIHTLVTLDDALKRRFTVNPTLDYLAEEQEAQVLEFLMQEQRLRPELFEEIPRIVKLGAAIRRERLAGNLQSVPPPTIYGYMAAVRMADALPHLSTHDIVQGTLLGHASVEDGKVAVGVFNEVFGLQADLEEDEVGGNLF